MKPRALLTKAGQPRQRAPGGGRPSIHEGGEVMKARPFRMTDEQYEKIMRLGGAVWLRKKIDAAK